MTAAPMPRPLPAYLHASLDVEFIAAQQTHGAVSVGTLHPDDPRWLPILVEEVGESAEALLRGDAQALIDELIQVAVVAVAWIDAIQHKRSGGLTWQ